MRALAEDNAAAGPCVELFRAAGPIQEIGEVQRRDHPHRPKGARRDQLARAQIGQVETVAVADNQAHASFPRRRDHRQRVGERQRHGLFNEHMSAGARRHPDVIEMMLVRRGDIDGLDIFIGAELFGRGIGRRAEIRRESLTRLGARIGGARENHTRMAHEGREHQREGATQPDDAEPQRAAHRAVSALTGRLGVIVKIRARERAMRQLRPKTSLRSSAGLAASARLGSFSAMP